MRAEISLTSDIKKETYEARLYVDMIRGGEICVIGIEGNSPRQAAERLKQALIAEVDKVFAEVLK